MKHNCFFLLSSIQIFFILLKKYQGIKKADLITLEIESYVTYFPVVAIAKLPQRHYKHQDTHWKYKIKPNDNLKN